MRAFGLYTHVRSNILKTILLILVFPFVLPAVFFFTSFFILKVSSHPDAAQISSGGAAGLLGLFLAITAVWLPIAYVFNRAIIDRATGAQSVSRAELPHAWNLLENLCISRGMRTPTLRLIEADALNAYASGVSEGSYSVTVTTGLLEALDDAELETVLAHELTHIRNRDVQLLVATNILVGVVPITHDIIVRAMWWLINGILAIYRGVFTLLPIPGIKPLLELVYGLLFLAAKVAAYVIGIVAFLFSLLINLAISRRREYLADAGAIELTKNPDALISALRKVAGCSDLETSIAGVRQMYFDGSLSVGLSSMFETHPPIEKRIEAIIKFGRDVAKTARDIAEPVVPLNSNAEKNEVGDFENGSQLESYRILLMRAIDRLSSESPESRRSIYELARRAQARELSTQQVSKRLLREREILEEAIASVEAERSIIGRMGRQLSS